MVYISKKWRQSKVVLGLILLELPIVVALLALTGIASPDQYRSKLWQAGGDQGFNSKPSAVLYAYANYEPVKTPLVWSSLNTQFALVISVLTMFIMLTKITMHIVHVWYPLISTIISGALVALWSASLYIQTAPDTIDPKRQNHGAPWYITKSCSVVTGTTLQGYCKQAKATFGVSVVMLALLVVQFVFAIWSMFPTKEQRLHHAAKRAEEKGKEKGSPSSELTAEDMWRRQWELGQIPPTPGTTGGLKSPMTPRTHAFNSLDGDLPLRTYA